MAEKLVRQEIEKIVVNAGIGRLSQQGQFEEKILPEVNREFSIITGQKAATRPAKKSIAGFKIREGQVIGLKATLRAKRMEDFFARLVTLTLPRVKDFRGLELSNIDESGNLNIGFKEQSVFPEIDMEKSKASFGLQVTIVPRRKNREHAIALYRRLGLPLKK
ncbi:50S ribosomal protein L5 [bacterium]|nr:MAG: 50S ribosomal protein L5 [bacterium]